MGVLRLGQKNYPKLLSKIKNPPKVLYYKGKLDPQIFKHCLAVVGSRGMTDYGEEVVEYFIAPIARAGITIVSGFMYGIDAASHRVCLENNGRTIAVLGCGINLIRPTDHRDLHEKIIENNGLMLSEYEDEHPAFRWTFVRRNRIISGLSQAVLVIEAGEKSGALITADLARKQGRKVLAVPGPITSGVSKGTAQLIKEGAKLVQTPDDILQELSDPGSEISRRSGRIYPVAQRVSLTGLSPEEKQILGLLENKRLSADEISRCLSQSAAQIGAKLSLMVIKGLLKEDKRGRYCH